MDVFGPIYLARSISNGWELARCLLIAVLHLDSFIFTSKVPFCVALWEVAIFLERCYRHHCGIALTNYVWNNSMLWFLPWVWPHYVISHINWLRISVKAPELYCTSLKSHVIMLKLWVVDVLVRRRFGLSTFRSVDVSIYRPIAMDSIPW